MTLKGASETLESDSNNNNNNNTTTTNNNNNNIIIIIIIIIIVIIIIITCLFCLKKRYILRNLNIDETTAKVLRLGGVSDGDVALITSSNDHPRRGSFRLIGISCSLHPPKLTWLGDSGRLLTFWAPSHFQGWWNFFVWREVSGDTIPPSWEDKLMNFVLFWTRSLWAHSEGFGRVWTSFFNPVLAIKDTSPLPGSCILKACTLEIYISWKYPKWWFGKGDSFSIWPFLGIYVRFPWCKPVFFCQGGLMFDVCDWGFCLVHPLTTFLLTSPRQSFMVWSPYWATGLDIVKCGTIVLITACGMFFWLCDFDNMLTGSYEFRISGKLHIDNHD